MYVTYDKLCHTCITHYIKQRFCCSLLSIFALPKQYVHVFVSKYKYCTYCLLPKMPMFQLKWGISTFLPPRSTPTTLLAH